MSRQLLNLLRTCRLYALVASLPLLASGSLRAAPLLPGAAFSPVPAENNPVGATLVFSTGFVPFTAATFNGSLRSDVYTNDVSSPFGPNFLTFVYEITNGAGSPDAIDRFTVSSFAGFQTDASFTPVPGPTAPAAVSRSANGAVIGFDFRLPGFPLAANSVGTPMVVQTNATLWAPTLASLIDGSVATVASVAPIGIPEPASVCLFVGGLALLSSARGGKPR
jgi:hypothetical protein